MEREGDRRGRGSQLRVAVSYSTIGLEMVLATLLGYWIGSTLDGRLATSPWLTALFVADRLGAAIRRIVRVVRRVLREDEDDEAAPGI